MTNKTGEEVVHQLVSEKLDEYIGTASEATPEVTPEATARPEEPGSTADVRQEWPEFSFEEWSEALKTPSVFSRAKVDKTLQDVRARAHLSEAACARFSEEDWAILSDTVRRYLLDVVEGCGLIVRSGEHIEEIGQTLDEMLRGMLFLDEKDGRFRHVQVRKTEGK